ncbi:hypothetical protein LTR16_006289, partial [Cryomyces antarcticus]
VEPTTVTGWLLDTLLANLYGTNNCVFPAAVLLHTSSWIGKALVGRVRWGNPLVVKERAVLLGEDRTAADALISKYRAETVVNVRKAWKEVELIEREFYGDKSFFRWLDTGATDADRAAIAPEDNADPLEEDEEDLIRMIPEPTTAVEDGFEDQGGCAVSAAAIAGTTKASTRPTGLPSSGTAARLGS